MTATIHLIVEDRRDAEVIRSILRAKKLNIQIRPMPPKSGGIFRLAKELDNLIQVALHNRESGDCIAVLHDADEQTQVNREVYEHIKRICTSYKKDVVLVVARDELEAWLLADNGVCQWLGIAPKNRDAEKRPSDTLAGLMQSKYKLKYQGSDRAGIFTHIDGTGDKFSPSMQKALQHLENAPCMKP
jgi:hypothetical protein